MSSSIALRRSPKPGALTAVVFRMPRMLLTTSVASASPSTSSAMISSGLPAFATCSSSGRRSRMLLIFLSCRRMIRIFEQRYLLVRIVDEVRRDVAAVELHALDEIELVLEALAVLDGDDAFLADLVHRLGDGLADRLRRRWPRSRPTCAISLLVVHGLLIFLSSSTTAITALSMPRFRSIGFMPAATYFMPSCTIDCASTVAVVVPSPATSDVLDATSLTICAPMFSNLSLSSISFATDTPSLVIVGAPKLRSSTTLRPFGPSVTLTALARTFTPAIIRLRTPSPKRTSLAAIFVSPEMLWCCSGSGDDADDVVFAHVQLDPAPSILNSWPEYLPNSTLSPAFTPIGSNLPLSSVLPGPAKTTSPWDGFSAAVSGITMPPADLRSSSSRLTITRSCKGRYFHVSTHSWRKC